MSQQEIKAITTMIENNSKNTNSNQSALKKMNVRIIDVKKDLTNIKNEPGKSQVLVEDPFKNMIDNGEIIEPPFDLLTLAMLVEHNTEMEECIAAMEINVESFGHRYIPRIKSKSTSDISEKLSKDILSEKVKLENFFMYCTKESFPKFRRKLRRDLELTGNAYFEVVRDVKNAIQSFTHIPSYQMRLGQIEEESNIVTRPILELKEDLSVDIVNLKEYRRFRKYVQSKSIMKQNMSVIYGNKIRWFKEFGDERIYNNETGELADKELPIEKRATEIIHLTIYSARSSYGLPRYIGNLLSIYGDRASEEINFVTFRNNNIPSMMVMVSNGQLTEGSIDRLTSFVESTIQGSSNYSKFIVLEAEGGEEGEEGNQVKLDVKPLSSEQNRDALFQNYSKNNQDKIRRVWRLPPIFLGKTDDYSRTTADSSRRLADEQVFAPERDEFDNLINRILFPYMGIRYHKFKSNSPNTTDNTQLVQILSSAEKTGGMTPRIARALLEDILGTELPEFVDYFDADVPFSLTMAEAVKNKADPTEPGQQVTALKNILGDDIEEKPFECSYCGNIEPIKNEDTITDPLINHLITLNKRLEKKWKEEVVTDEDHEDHEH